jgi:hypothetical protein
MDSFDEFIARINLDEVPTGIGVSTIAGEIRNDLFEKAKIRKDLHRMARD